MIKELKLFLMVMVWILSNQKGMKKNFVVYLSFF